MKIFTKILILKFGIIILVSRLIPIEYTVVKGDCLWKIAKKYYGDPFLWRQIYEFNSEKIKNPDLIYPGQVFVLPELSESKKVENSYIITSTQKEVQQLKEWQQQNNVDIIKPHFPERISINNFNKIGRIVAGEEKKFVYIDNDIIKINLEKNVTLTIGEIVGIYHEGPSQYNLRLSGMRRGQLSLVAKAKVLSVNGQGALCEII
ncbi:MAG: LysM peptidoglycan-binding domain-containing protein, partial [Endomicrobia bacterium]|nr:LysM peptidoglycan-binding domain-containing protein [Endomicrobiia bacterium]